MGAWRDFICATIRRALAARGLDGGFPVEEAADVILATFLVVELLGHLDGDTERAHRLFAAGRVLAGLLLPLGPAVAATPPAPG
jgi:hypothetical protein